MFDDDDDDDDDDDNDADSQRKEKNTCSLFSLKIHSNNLWNIDIWYITSENLSTKTLTRSRKIDPSTVFSAFDMDKLGKSAPVHAVLSILEAFFTELAKHFASRYSSLGCDLELSTISVIGFVWEFR